MLRVEKFRSTDKTLETENEYKNIYEKMKLINVSILLCKGYFQKSLF